MISLQTPRPPILIFSFFFLNTLRRRLGRCGTQQSGGTRWNVWRDFKNIFWYQRQVRSWGLSPRRVGKDRIHMLKFDPEVNLLFIANLINEYDTFPPLQLLNELKDLNLKKKKKKKRRRRLFPLKLSWWWWWWWGGGDGRSGEESVQAVNTCQWAAVCVCVCVCVFGWWWGVCVLIRVNTRKTFVHLRLLCKSTRTQGRGQRGSAGQRRLAHGHTLDFVSWPVPFEWP